MEAEEEMVEMVVDPQVEVVVPEAPVLEALVEMVLADHQELFLEEEEEEEAVQELFLEEEEEAVQELFLEEEEKMVVVVVRKSARILFFLNKFYY